MDEGLEHFDLGIYNTNDLTAKIITNSEQLMINILLKTDLLDVGISLYDHEEPLENIREIEIEGEEATLVLGYVIDKDHPLTSCAKSLIKQLEEKTHNN